VHVGGRLSVYCDISPIQAPINSLFHKSQVLPALTERAKAALLGIVHRRSYFSVCAAAGAQCRTGWRVFHQVRDSIYAHGRDAWLLHLRFGKTSLMLAHLDKQFRIHLPASLSSQRTDSWHWISSLRIELGRVDLGPTAIASGLWGIQQFLSRDAMHSTDYMLSQDARPSVCPSVHLSHAGIVSKRLILKLFYHRVAIPF